MKLFENYRTGGYLECQMIQCPHFFLNFLFCLTNKYIISLCVMVCEGPSKFICVIIIPTPLFVQLLALWTKLYHHSLTHSKCWPYVIKDGHGMAMCGHVWTCVDIQGWINMSWTHLVKGQSANHCYIKAGMKAPFSYILKETYI